MIAVSEILEYLSFGDTGWGDELLKGLWITLMLAFTALPVGLILGTIVASFSISKSRTAKTFALFYTTIIRGLPELLTLFIIYHGVGLLINQILKWFSSKNLYFEFSPFLAGVVALGLVFSGYSAEVLRGAWQSIDKGQREAGISLSMKRVQIFWLIERPQIMRIALPGLGNLWINLIKDTALVSVIALDDLMRVTNIAVGSTKEPFLFYLTVCLIYWGVCIIFERILEILERRSNRGFRSNN
ncbi:ABC transporter permease subunit [Marinomonas sp. A79]|uniref:ABC transporter permease subunit n=1 Tax=Marinomonas vulgaris TaxID=2823372 RepID=A0ABS5HES9_9GAMM|nr:ABC transporter permease subunit [Marinomonas vulgaris]MBR7890161.1 ABC transporter permease subunit [Marinomonas vulgaris]